jgi:acyl-coenzyme A synthetase/AMP-(fatty) acid ligase
MNNPKTLVDDDIRAAISRDHSIASGNFLNAALAASPAPEEPILMLERKLKPFNGGVFSELSLRDLDGLALQYAGLYARLGVRPQDPIVVYLDDGIEYLIHYLALSRLGAIGVLTNGNMPPAIALAHARNVGAVGIYTDRNHEAAFSGAENEFRFLATAEKLSNLAREDLVDVPPYRHDALDPVMIAHSSGTTGVPKAVLLQHEGFFYGVRYRLGVARVPGGETILSSLPHSHNCAIAYLMLALLSGTPVYITSDHSGESVLKRIEQVKPRMVVSFPQTYVEMTECDLESFDLSSVSLWFNGGDAAHEAHIRALIKRGSHLENGKRVSGSIFIDGMGSSEMGFSIFRNVHTQATNNYNRCVGQPLEWVDAQILSENGDRLGPFQIGRMGVKAPSVTTGYWNNSVLTYRSRLAGYFLTGDLGYRDDKNRFYHVDRTPDVIRTPSGPVYGLRTEEFLLSRFGGLVDCTVFGRSVDSSEIQIPAIRIKVRPNSDLSELSEHTILELFNRRLHDADLPELRELKIVASDEIPLGTTGKVLKRELRSVKIAHEMELVV